jgi:UTP-glucose-1-phosphate uridylyltransferase
VEEAIEAGITQLVFVTGRTKRAIEDHFDTNPARELRDKVNEIADKPFQKRHDYNLPDETGLLKVDS